MILLKRYFSKTVTQKFAIWCIKVFPCLLTTQTSGRLIPQNIDTIKAVFIIVREISHLFVTTLGSSEVINDQSKEKKRYRGDLDVNTGVKKPM